MQNKYLRIKKHLKISKWKLTKPGAISFILAIILLFVSQVSATNILLILSVSILTLFALTFFYNASFFFNFGLHLSYKKHVYKNTELKIQITVLNKGFFVTPTMKWGLNIYSSKLNQYFLSPKLYPNQAFSISPLIPLEQRGHLKELEIETHSNAPFNLLEIFKTYKIPIDLTVYPISNKHIKSPVPTFQEDLFGNRLNSKRAPSGLFNGVRDYHSQDSLRDIHWMKTASKNSLVIKEYESLSSNHDCLGVVLCPNDNKLYEEFIDSIASLGQHWISNKIQLSLWFNSHYFFQYKNQKTPKKNRQNYMSFLANLPLDSRNISFSFPTSKQIKNKIVIGIAPDILMLQKLKLGPKTFKYSLLLNQHNQKINKTSP